MLALSLKFFFSKRKTVTRNKIFYEYKKFYDMRASNFVIPISRGHIFFELHTNVFEIFVIIFFYDKFLSQFFYEICEPLNYKCKILYQEVEGKLTAAYRYDVLIEKK